MSVATAPAGDADRPRSAWPGPTPSGHGAGLPLGPRRPARRSSARSAALRRPRRLPRARAHRRCCSTTPPTSSTCCRPPLATGPSRRSSTPRWRASPGPGCWRRPNRAGSSTDVSPRPPSTTSGSPRWATRCARRPTHRRRRAPRRTARRRGAADVVDVAALTHRIGLDAVGRALFAPTCPTTPSDLLAATSEAAELVVPPRPLDPAHAPSGPRPGPTSGSAAARRRLDAGSPPTLIAERRARNARAGGTPHHGDDLLGLLLDSGLD